MKKSTWSTLLEATVTCQVTLPETVFPFSGVSVLTSSVVPALAGMTKARRLTRRPSERAKRSRRRLATEAAADLMALRIDPPTAPAIPRLRGCGRMWSEIPQKGHRRGGVADRHERSRSRAHAPISRIQILVHHIPTSWPTRARRVLKKTAKA